MKRPVKLNFGERMREWRKARKDYADKVKQKVKEKAEIEDTYPKLATPVENKTMSLSPTQSIEMKVEGKSIILNPSNKVEEALNKLRSRII